MKILITILILTKIQVEFYHKRMRTYTQIQIVIDFYVIGGRAKMKDIYKYNLAREPDKSKVV